MGTLVIVATRQTKHADENIVTYGLYIHIVPPRTACI